MKAYLILCILLASLLFFPSSLLARDLAASAGKATPATRDPNKPACNPGGRGTPYKCNQEPKPRKCEKYDRNCPHNSSP
ncbi:hypothetical protein TIFTF001_046511 [Ficus carica]|uniref:Rapid ALkalinization Factor n=1 Tax=Ficus carica TaxID=3494 RepID=A0AA88CQZ4_FICCA|nr:hypothetical protein TIFTF001_046510 [Ficus carica]GMN31403.1 hypothetical protein TIFTF001_046511 [Ficus carica]